MKKGPNVVKVTYKHWKTGKILEVVGTMPKQYNNGMNDRILVQKPDGSFEDVIKTTIVIIVSLLPLLFSEFKSISQLAYITIISAIVAIVFDLIYLPKLLKRYIK